MLGGSNTTERIFVNYINENRVATPFGITTLFCHVSISLATSYIKSHYTCIHSNSLTHRTTHSICSFVRHGLMGKLNSLSANISVIGNCNCGTFQDSRA